MSKGIRYNIAKCSTEKTCKKCGYIGGAIVAKRGPHYTLYCSYCGAYIKHAGIADQKHFYIDKAVLEDLTPTKVGCLYIDSARTMIRRN